VNTDCPGECNERLGVDSTTSCRASTHATLPGLTPPPQCTGAHLDGAVDEATCEHTRRVRSTFAELAPRKAMEAVGGLHRA